MHPEKTYIKIRKALQFGGIGKSKTAEFWLKNRAFNNGMPDSFLGNGVAFLKGKFCSNTFRCVYVCVCICIYNLMI